MSNEMDAWPGGETWVFQGTVAEDSTGGTHVCTLTVTPGVGNEMQIQGGSIIVGNGAANLTTVYITDGTNTIELLSPIGVSNAANTTFPFPQGVTAITAGSSPGPSNFIVSGSMQLVLKVSTATISLTHTFTCVCRIKGAMPTATLADTVGSPVLTINTNKVF